MKAVFIFLLAFSLRAEVNFNNLSFVDQFDSKIELTNDFEYLIFSKDKVASEMANEAFNELNFYDLNSKKIIYVADISKMPSFVTKLFAMPKMRKYKYKIALDREGVTTKDWPFKEEQLTFIKLNKLKEESVKFISNKDTLKSELNVIIGQKLSH